MWTIRCFNFDILMHSELLKRQAKGVTRASNDRPRTSRLGRKSNLTARLELNCTGFQELSDRLGDFEAIKWRANPVRSQVEAVRRPPEPLGRLPWSSETAGRNSMSDLGPHRRTSLASSPVTTPWSRRTCRLASRGRSGPVSHLLTDPSAAG